MLVRSDALEFVKRYRRHIERLYYISMADVEDAPRLVLDPDGMESFHLTGKNKNGDPESIISIGLRGMITYYKVEDFESLLFLCKYVLHHESSHARHTACEPYAWGIRMCTETVIEYIADRLKIPVSFSSEGDYKFFVTDTLQKDHGIYVGYKTLQKTLAGLINAVEDGRIERMQAQKFPGFEKMRQYVAAYEWKEYPVTITLEQAEKDPMRAFIVLRNEILSLSVAQIHSKGFMDEYAGSGLEKVVQSMMPHIYRGIMGRTTRIMAEHCVEMVKALCPYIYDALVHDIGIKKDRLQEMIAEAYKRASAEMNEDSCGDLDEKNEEKNENGNNTASTFPYSDFEVTLEDEEYDKLMENSSSEDKNENGIRLRRKNPKPEEETEERQNTDTDETNDSGKEMMGHQGEVSEKKRSDEFGEERESSENTSNEAKNESSNASSSSDRDEEGEEGFECGFDEELGDEFGWDDLPEGEEESMESHGTGDENADSDNKEKDVPQKGLTEEHEAEESLLSGGNDIEERASSKDSGGKGDMESNESMGPATRKNGCGENEDMDAEDMILAAMEEAAKKGCLEAGREMEEVDFSTTQAERKFGAERGQETPIITREDAEKLGVSNFKEFTRKYELTDELPADAALIARSIRPKFERRLQNRRTGAIRYKSSGAVDPTRLSSLAMRETDIYMEETRPKKTSCACYIAVDNSGSMGGVKRKQALRAAGIFESIVDGLIPTKIIAFDYWSTVNHEIIKDWNERHMTNCAWNFYLHGRTGGGNDDGKDIRIATHELSKRPEERKLFIILSDGTPADESDCAEAVREMRKKGIFVVSIYFEQFASAQNIAAFHRMYGEDKNSKGACIVCKPSEIFDNMLEVLDHFTN